MIFCSVGTQLPFPRLIDYLTLWSEKVDNHNTQIIVQSGDKRAKKNGKITSFAFVSESEFSEYMTSAAIIVSHAGMGNIIRAIELNKPIVIVPRLSDLKEHRNDHQIDSANRFCTLDNVFIANDYDSFCNAINSAFHYVKSEGGFSFPEREKLISYLESEIHNIKY